MTSRGSERTSGAGRRQRRLRRPAASAHPACGGSNGDPHLKTIDGKKYELQAAGEYVLLRSGDGSIEIQGRQELPCVVGAAFPPPPFAPTCQATINTAVAVKENGHRVGFYVSGDVPTVHVDGKPIEASQVATADLGPGTKLTGYRRGCELDLPNGTGCDRSTSGRARAGQIGVDASYVRGCGLLGWTR